MDVMVLRILQLATYTLERESGFDSFDKCDESLCGVVRKRPTASSVVISADSRGSEGSPGD